MAPWATSAISNGYERQGMVVRLDTACGSGICFERREGLSDVVKQDGYIQNRPVGWVDFAQLT